MSCLMCRIKSGEAVSYLKKPFIRMKNVPLFMTASVADSTVITVLWPGNEENG